MSTEVTGTVEEKWGARVRSQRDTMGFTQVQLAEMCGVTQQHLSRIELGLVMPRMRLRMTLAGALRTTVDRLFPNPGTREWLR